MAYLAKPPRSGTPSRLARRDASQSRVSTLRRAGDAILYSGGCVPRNPFEAEDWEFEELEHEGVRGGSASCKEESWSRLKTRVRIFDEGENGNGEGEEEEGLQSMNSLRMDVLKWPGSSRPWTPKAITFAGGVGQDTPSLRSGDTDSDSSSLSGGSSTDIHSGVQSSLLRGGTIRRMGALIPARSCRKGSLAAMLESSIGYSRADDSCKGADVSLLSSTKTLRVSSSPLPPTKGSSASTIPSTSSFYAQPPSATSWKSIFGQKEKETSIWDAEDDEFDRWPGQDTLDRVARVFTARGTDRPCDNLKLKYSPQVPVAEEYDSVSASRRTDKDQILCSATLSAQEHDDVMHELMDKRCGSPHGHDMHDGVMKQFFSSRCLALPASSPARHMHIISPNYMSSEDNIVRCTFPRLCDAVATVLYMTHPKCLEDFLNPSVRVFEWRKDGNCAVINRKGNQVIVGTYHNFATKYVWTYFVRSQIAWNGTWSEQYASVGLVTTPISEEGVAFDNAESEQSAFGISPEDEKYALFVGRDLGHFLLSREIWRYRYPKVPGTVQWEADGKVVDPKEFDRYQLGRT